MAYECELREQAAQPVLVVRTRTPLEGLPQALGEAYGAIGRYLALSGGRRAGAPFVAYHNMDMQDLEVDIGLPVAKRLKGTDTIRSSVIPRGTYAVCVHQGPYTELHQAYTALAGWMAENGHQATGPSYEVYLNDPSQTPAEKLLTQIAFRLEQ
jgi:effector-binding domain-containing protein